MDEEKNTPQAKRITLTVKSLADLQRSIQLPYECSIKIPSVGLDARKIFGMTGMSMDLDRFIDVMHQDIEDSPMPISSKTTMQMFLYELNALKDESSMPWKLILEDDEGEVDIEKWDGDCDENYSSLSFIKLSALEDLSSVRQIDPIVELIKKKPQICFLNGAGISVNSGIKDYRSKGGLYNTLNPELFTATDEEKEKLTASPEYIVDIRLFSSNPLPLWEYKRDWILNSLHSPHQPTFAHWFMFKCYKEGLLRRIYTQNIDGLELVANIPSTHLVQVHGNLQEAVCYYCDQTFPMSFLVEKLKTHIRDITGKDPTAPSTSTVFLCPNCQRPGIKPKVVLFNEPVSQLDEYSSLDFPDNVGLLIVAGTSLKVAPINKLPELTTCPRLLVNNKLAGEDVGFNFTSPPGDVDYFCGGDCDESFKLLAEKLGWKDDILEEKRKFEQNKLD